MTPYRSASTAYQPVSYLERYSRQVFSTDLADTDLHFNFHGHAAMGLVRPAVLKWLFIIVPNCQICVQENKPSPLSRSMMPGVVMVLAPSGA